MASSGVVSCSLCLLLASVTLLLLLVTAQTSRAEVKQKLYLIQGHKVADEVSAAGQLRNFLGMRLSAHERCQRYSILLNAYQRKKSTLTGFQIADIGMLKREDVEKRFNSFDIETLRDLYINAILKYMNASQVDGAMVELYKCLSTEFGSRDAKARSFLNNDEVKQIVDQYESIAEQPVKLLVEQQVRHPSLKLDDLHPTVRAAVAQWYPDDARALENLFERRAAPAAATVRPEPEFVTPQAHAQASASATAAPHAQAQVEASATATAPTDAAAAAEFEDDGAYLGYVFGSIIATYESVPLETSLSERCQAYSKVVDAERDELMREDYVDGIVRGIAENLGKQQSTEPFVPDETRREDFLFVLQTVDPLQGGHEAWTDMVDCVSQWEAVDPEAARFMHSPELAQTFQQMLELTGESAPAAAADPATEAGAHAGPAAEANAAAAATAAAAAASTANVHDAPPAPHVAPK